ALNRFAFAELNRQLRTGVVDPRALLAELQSDPAAAELLCELLRGVFVLPGDETIQHLDDRHFAPEALENRCELGADDAAAEDHEPARHLRLREEPRGVDTAR